MMRRGSSHTKPDGVPPEGSRRKFGRVRCELARTDIGFVMDGSPGGLRIRLFEKMPFEVGQEFPLKFAPGDEVFEIQVEVTWVAKRGLFKHEIGVKFLESTPAMRKALNQMAQEAAHNYGFGTGSPVRSGI